jgi:GTPase Era involved in 16S rRNA processing
MMVIGKNGEVLKGVQRRAEDDLKQSLGKEIQMRLEVVIRHKATDRDHDVFTEF